jgi:hypothetical protein
MRLEELDDLAPLRRSTPGTEAEPLLEVASTAGASRHPAGTLT